MLRIIICVLLLAATGAALKKDERLRDVSKLFVKGTNQGAEEARKTVLDGKTCFTLVGKAEDADAVLELSESTTEGRGLMGVRNTVISGTLTLKSGDLVWSGSERWSDRPGKSGAKIAGDLVVRKLAKDAECKARAQK